MRQIRRNRRKQNRSLQWAAVLLGLTGVMVFLGGCGKEQEYHGKYIFCLDANETKVDYEEYTPKAEQQEELIEEYLLQMQTEPSDISKKKAFPDDVRVEEYTIDDSGQLILYFNAAYGNLSGVGEILRRAAIVKTLCQVDGIEGVQFYVSGQPLTDSNMTAIGYMTADTFIDNTGGETAYQQNVVLTMYFSDYTGNHLVEVPVDITYDAMIPLEQLAIEQLIEGPYSIEGVDQENVLPTIPAGTEMNKVTVKDNTCYVDFSADFLQKRNNVSAEATVYSVVNTLSELSNINKVQFSIDGEQVQTYNETMDFGSVFERNLDIVTTTSEN